MVNLCVKKKIFAVFMTAIILLSTVSVTVSAYNFNVLKDRREIVIDGVVIDYAVTDNPFGDSSFKYKEPVAVICGFFGTSDFDGDLNVPAELDGYPVCAILTPNSVYAQENNMKSNTDTGTYRIEIPDSIIYIEDHAFTNFKYLESVKMPITDTRTISTGEYSAPKRAFAGCERLRSVVLTNPDQRPYSIGGYCFDGCKNLESVTLPEGLEGISEWAFGGCCSLKEIDLPEGLTAIGPCAFSDADLRSIDLPDSLTEIGMSAFSYNINLSSVNNFSDRISISGNAFNGTAIYNDRSNWDGDNFYLGDTFMQWYPDKPSRFMLNGEIWIKDGTKRLAENALLEGEHVKKMTVHIPSSVKYIPSIIPRNTDTEELSIIYEGTKEMWDSIAPQRGFNAKAIKYIFLGDIVFGDLDGDGIITLKDTCRMKALILCAYEPTALEKAAADMNGDGVINTRDAFLLKRALLLG